MSNYASGITTDRFTNVCSLWIRAGWKINVVLIFILLYSIESGILSEMHLLHELVAAKSRLILDGPILVHHMWALDQFLASLTVDSFLILIGLMTYLESAGILYTLVWLYEIHHVHFFEVIFCGPSSWRNLISTSRTTNTSGIPIFLVSFICVSIFIDSDRVASLISILGHLGCEILVIFAFRMLTIPSIVLVWTNVIAGYGVSAAFTFLVFVDHGWRTNGVLLLTSLSSGVCVAALLESCKIIVNLSLFYLGVNLWEADWVFDGRLVHVWLVATTLFVNINVHMVWNSGQPSHCLLGTWTTSCDDSRNTTSNWTISVIILSNGACIHIGTSRYTW